MDERIVTLQLDQDMKIAVLAEAHGPQLVADDDIVAKLGTVAKSVECVSRELLDAIKRAAPSKGSLELSFGLAVEEGHLIALLGKAKGEATIRVTLEWSAPAAGK